ncbi:MAG: GNAT family N-acetyltransferase [Burkholderiales bacterium PBB4]|nr:MAG: GNAT family N-acetyltransferase [Burkholderiales bacterium PBB4]
MASVASGCSNTLTPKLLVPIRSLGENHRTRIGAHLLALDERDRYLRFGYAAQDAQILRYVEGLDFERDEIFGIYNRQVTLIAVAHLAMPATPSHARCAEFGVSVSSKARGRGWGGRLFERAALSAANAGVELMFIHALNENAAMLRIARKAGAHVERDGPESEAYLKLPAGSFDTQLAEMLGEQVAQLDYQIKVQAKQFWEFLASMQAIRRATEDAQRIEGS